MEDRSGARLILSSSHCPSKTGAPMSGADPGIPERGSKIKFMKGEGTGGGVPHPWRGLGHNPSRFFSFPFIWHET